jgi:Flp pilus assembly protein TadG
MAVSGIGDDRGTAMTEGVIVVPFFIIVWMGLSALHHLQGGRLEAQLAAGAAALAAAGSGECDGATTSLADFPQTAGVTVDLGEEEESMLEAIAGCQPLSWNHAQAAAEVTVHHVPVPLGGPERTVSGRRVLMCNMKPVDGLLELVADVVTTALGIGDE